ncbi:Gfo/Idh/MocA family oxidoreductase [Pseudolysinimonas kribbensis]|uniref:Gfo/Idh/MocA family protein n=1 Tax=Pseudolysinimonas kribbensis TaxID=433641 RepID=UPI0031E012E9
MVPVNTYRVAIVGTGEIASEHAAALRRLSDRARLVGAVDVDEARVAEFARRWDVPSSFEALTRLLASETLDVVHICTPPSTHVPLALECLSAGVVPLLEKPPALSLEQLDALLDAERRSGVPVAVVFQHRFGGVPVRLREAPTRAALGRPLVATCNTLWFRDDEYYATPWRGSWASEGGGPTMGHGIHQFDLLLSILGDWQLVTALAGRQSRPTETEDVSAAVVRFANGAIATILNSLVSIRETSYLRIDYENATVELEHLYGYTDADWRVTGLDGRALPALTASREGAETSSHVSQLRAVLDALDRGDAPPVTLADSRRSLELAAAIYASAFGGGAIRPGDIAAGTPFYSSMQGTGAPWLDAGRQDG